MAFKIEKDKLINSICVMLLPLISYGILGPMEMYAASPTDFNFSLWTVFALMFFASLIVFVVGVAVLYFLPKRISLFCRKLLLVFGVVSYVQYLFLNRQLARRDGNAMDWTSMKSTIIIYSLVWVTMVLLLMVLSFVAKRHWEKIGNGIAVLLMLVQLAAIVSILFTTPKGSNDAYRISSENQYTVAKGENIIILIIDSYGNRQLDATVEKDADLLYSLKDFTYYNNCDSHYDRTYPTVTSMITGIPYDFDTENPERYTTKAWTSDRANSFFDELHEEGWNFDVYAVNSGCNYGNLECNKDKIDNISYVEGSIRWKRVLTHFTKASIYKFGPYFIKPYVEEITSDFADINIYPFTFDDHMEHLTRVLNEDGISILENVDNRITIFHTFGAHDAKSPSDIEEIHKYIELYLNNLKKIDKYDDSTIIITADHGMMWSFKGDDPQPVFFIKRPGESREAISISQAPISEEDFQGTIMELIGVDTEEYGPSIFDWEESTHRERTFYYGDTDHSYNGYTYFTNREELLSKLEGEPTIIGVYENE